MRSIVFVAPTLVPFVTLASYSAFGNELTLEMTFLTISFISVLRFPLLLIPQSYAFYFEVNPCPNTHTHTPLSCFSCSPPSLGHSGQELQ